MPSIRPYIIGIAGASCSGKTLIADLLSKRLPGSSAVLALDSYYRDLSKLTTPQKQTHNFDIPDALDRELLTFHVCELAAGRHIEKPVYDFNTHCRMTRTELVAPVDFLIIEGIFTLYWPDVRKAIGTKAFIHISKEVSLKRRTERDQQERGRTKESIAYQLNATVWPMYEKYVLPTRYSADIILDGENPMEKAVQELLGHCGSNGISDNENY